MTFQERAMNLLDRGFSIIPLESQDKDVSRAEEKEQNSALFGGAR
jgi:hypothetical protein